MADMAAEGDMAGPGEAAVLTMSDGFQIHAQTWRAETPIGVALFLHGWTDMIDSLAVRRLAAGLLAKQVTLVAYDHDMHGKSVGIWPGCCRGNIYDLRVGSLHCVDVARIVITEHKLPFVLMGHSLGGGTAMLATERIAKVCKEQGETFKGAVFMAPGNESYDSDAYRWCCCPCNWAKSKCCCYACPEDSFQELNGVPGEANLAPTCSWLPPTYMFRLPEHFGGFAGPAWWSQHNAGVPYTIMVGSDDEVCDVPSQQKMHEAAPYGKCHVLEDVDHEPFHTENWPEMVKMHAQEVADYCQNGSSPEAGS